MAKASKPDPITDIIRDSLQRHLGPTLGYLVYSGSSKRYPITKIEFKGGMIHLGAKLYGPITWRCKGNIRVYGEDHILLLEAHINKKKPIKVKRGNVLTINQTIILNA